MKKTKILLAILALALAVTMIAGCGSTGGTGDIAIDDEAIKGLEGTLCSKEPLTLTIHMLQGINTWNEEGSVEKAASADTNISLDCVTASSQTDQNEAFNLMLASDPLPDIIFGTSKNTNQAGMDGAMIPLEDLIKKYCPNMMEYFESHPEALKGSLAADGHLYYIPCVYEPGPAMGWFIRQDWLDKLGLSVPTNVEEFHNVLLAFKNNDPNGNGKKDEVPYFDRHKSVQNLYYLFGLTCRGKYYDFDLDKKEVYASSVTDEFKNAVKELSKWYAEGLIDPEIFTRGSNAREELFTTDLGGCITDWFSSSFAFNGKLKDKGFKLIAIDPPANINGDVINVAPRTTLNGNGWGISKDNKHIAETLKYFDYYFTERGGLAVHYGVEGVNYNMVNGEPVFTEEALNYPDGVPQYQSDFGSREIGHPVMTKSEMDGMSADAAKYFQMYLDKDYTSPEDPKLEFTPEENKVLSEKGTAVDTYFSENVQSWILGNSDVDATWDNYVKTMKSVGLDECIKIYQDAYNRFLGK